ncbi:unnamed protein product [Malus baccata var. baccata]
MSGDDHSMIVERALNSLGKGFDLTSDFRLKYCKGGKQRLVVLNDTDRRELTVPGFRTIQNVSVDIKCDKGDRIRYQSDILTFNQMSEFFNQRSSVPGKIPSGLFNAMFGFDSGSWAQDAANIKHLALDGYYIIFFNVHIDRYPLVLADEVRESVPSTWDPPALARFIEKYGTHIVVGLSVGGEDVVLVKQDKSSNMQPSDLKNHLNELGDQQFTGACSFSPSHSKSKDQKHKGISVIFYKKGGDLLASSHYEWLLTAPSMPDAIQFSFIPITSLLKDVPGKGFLSHAINLYLRYKPPIDDLQYFLDFQTHKLWAPVLNGLALGPASNRKTRSPAIHVNRMVRVAFRPVTGMRLYLEGRKANRLAVHLQHLSNTPFMLQNKIDDTPTWRGSDEIADDRYFEAINRKKISHVCTVPVKFDPKWMSSNKDASFIVSGVQLVVKKHDTKNVLHLRLLFSKVSDHFVVQSNWTEPPSEHSQKPSSSGLFSAISTSISGSNWSRDRVLPDDDRVIVDSSVFPTGPPVPLQLQKFVKYVDMSHLCRGPQDGPGYWLVTGARLNLVKGKISLQVKFSLLNLCSPSPSVTLRDLMYSVVDLEA